jgi:predicted component of type VI protein secretion system
VRRTEAHPTVLFGELLGLAGRLWAAAPGTGPAPHELPQYDHAEPTAAFSALSAAVEQLLGGKAPRQNYVRIAMVQSRPNLFEAALTPEVLASPGLVFTVRRNGSSPEQLKVSPRRTPSRR